MLEIAYLSFKNQKFPGGEACPQTPLEARTFGQFGGRLSCLRVLVKHGLSQPRTQGLTYGKDPGWGWSRDFTKIDWIRGEDRVSNCMLPQKMLHFNYKE